MMRRDLISLVLVGTFLMGTAVCAEGGSLFTARRVFGLVSLAGSGFFFKEGWDYHEKANTIYDEYELADTEEEAERLYNKTSRYDRRSEVHLLVGSLLALNGLRLLLIGGVEDWAEMAKGPSKAERSPEAVSIQIGRAFLRLGGDLRRQELRMSIDHRF